MRRLLVLPTYDEGENIAGVLRDVAAADPGLDVLVVDDASPDGTAEIAENEARANRQITVLRRSGKLGLGSAYRTGFAWGLERGYDVLLEMDADFSHDPKDLPRLIEAIEDGADLALGSRYVVGGSIPAWSWHRRMLSAGGNRYARWALQVDVADMTSGFRAYRASVLRQVDLTALATDGYGFQIEMVRQITRLGGRVAEIPISFVERSNGRSKMSTRIVAEALLSVTKWGLADRLARMPPARHWQRADCAPGRVRSRP